jgi:putative ABC transport system permease protein
MKKSLSNLDIILQNLTKRFLRSILMLFLIFILSFTVFSGSMILRSLELGITSTAERMGADIVAVPESYVSELQNALFTGVPCTVYFDREWAGKIQAVDGVGKISHQLYLSTIIDSDCCDNNLQIIAFNPETDFVVQPWIKRTLGDSLSRYRIIVGNNLKYVPGDTARFYGEKFLVAAKLEKTGMGYDNSVFLTYDTAYDLVQKPVVSNYFSIGNRENLVSMITVKVKDGYDVITVAQNIKKLYGKDGISVFTSSSLLKGISDNLKNFTAYSTLLNGLLLTSTVFALLSIFIITINERKREFGILRTLGASRSRIIILIAGEAGIISAVGSVLGSLTAGVLIYTFQHYIIHVFKVPFLQPQFGAIVLIAVRSLVVSLAAGLISSLYAAAKISSAQVYSLIKENEA